MGSFLAVIGFLGFTVFIILAIVSAIKKTGKGKKRMLFAAGCFVIMIIGGSLSPEAKETSGSTSKVENTSKKIEVSTKQKAANEAKKVEDAQNKAEADAKKKAEEDAAAKKKAEEEAKNPDWNVKDTNFETNKNGALALNLLKVMGDISQKGIAADAGTVFKTPWNYYGKPTKLSGSVVIVQDYPPGSDEANAGLLSQVVFMAEDGTPIIVFSTVPSGNLKVDDDLTVVGYPVGIESVDNKLGGKTDELVMITNKLQ